MKAGSLPETFRASVRWRIRQIHLGRHFRFRLILSEPAAPQCLLFLTDVLVLPAGEVAALEGQVEQLQQRDHRRAHPQPDRAAQVRDELRLLE